VDRDALAELGVSVSSDDEPEEVDLGARLREVGERAGPAFGRLVAALRSGWTAVVAAAGPRARALWVWIARLAETVRSELSARWPVLVERLRALKPGATPKRRSTMAPPELDEDRKATKAKRSEAAPEIATKRPRVPLRFVLLGAVLLGATMFVVRAMAPDEEPPPVTHEPTLAITETHETAPAAAPEAAPAAVAAAPVSAEPSSAATPEPAPTGATTETRAPVLPGTLGASPTEAGRLDRPTFPRVGEGATADTASTEPEAEALPRPTGRLSFGAADVPHGRSTTLTMTLPIASIEGEANDSGFTVNLPGVNSLSRAAPIAAANPSVERAAILNSGDHAVLTVRFVAGRTPAYRVEARGAELVVTIGR
jgi:hypothetical protein